MSSAKQKNVALLTVVNGLNKNYILSYPDVIANEVKQSPRVIANAVWQSPRVIANEVWQSIGDCFVALLLAMTDCLKPSGGGGWVVPPFNKGR